MKNWPCQFYVAKVTRTLGHALPAGLTLEVSVNSAHAGIHQAAKLRFMTRFIHDLWMLYLSYRVSFLRDRRMINERVNWRAKGRARFPLEKGYQIGPP